MKKLIIEMYRGLLAGVYSDSCEEFDVQEIDADDQYDDERMADYYQVQLQIERGNMVDIYNTPAVVQTPEQQEFPLAMRDSRALLLVPDIYEAKTPTGKQQQQLDVAFIDGFLNAWGRISRYILGLNRSGNAEERERARMLQQYLDPVLQQMDADYTAFCGKVVSPDIYDQGECPKECTNTGLIM